MKHSKSLSLAARQRHVQTGLTLVELLVGLALGLIVTAALLLLFANASASGQNLARSGAQIENGRYVSELLREELRLAGFYGEISASMATDTVANHCAPTAFPATPVAFPVPVQGIASDDADDLACLPDHKSDTDAIAVHRLDVEALPVASVASEPSYFMQYSFCESGIDAQKVKVGKGAEGVGTFDLHARACTTENTVRKYVSRIYYVATCNRCDPSDNIPTLKRVDIVGGVAQAPVALADGVEEMRFEYGLDTTAGGDGSADEYRTADDVDVALWPDVMTVKAHFITKSPEKVLGDQLSTDQTFNLGAVEVEAPADGHSRRAYSSVIRLVNPSSVREGGP